MTTHGWLVRQVCKLAAELTDEIERGDKADFIEVELLVRCYDAPYSKGAPLEVTEHIRRTRSNQGEWGGTERLTLEKWG